MRPRPRTKERVMQSKETTMQLGGMALRDGVLLLSDRFWAAAVRQTDGDVRIHSGRRVLLPGRDRMARVPLLRGMAKLAESMAVLPDVRREVGVPVLPHEDPKILAYAAVGSVASTALRRSRGGSPLLKELMISALSLGPAMLAVRDSRLSAFHGAEHKSIAGYETGEDAAQSAKEHTRCGTNLLAPLAITSVASNLALRRAGAERQPLAVLAAGLVSIGGAVEMFSWMARHEGHPLAELLRKPGIQLQRLLTTREPSEDQLDVAQAALAELLRLEGDKQEVAPVTAEAATA
jgi:uncharacterized protein YqhQ